MSYQKRKLKRKLSSRLKFKVGPAWNWLKRKKALLKQKRRKKMRQTQKIMDGLSALREGVQNGKRIDGWTASYVNDRILNGAPVEILLEWCAGLSLARRMEAQGGRFIPLPAEIDLVQRKMPRVLDIFAAQNVSVTWIVTFNRSYIARRRLPDEPFFAYMEMIRGLAADVPAVRDNVAFFDWDELSAGIEPNREITDNFDSFVKRSALDYEMKAFVQMLKQYPDALEDETELRDEAKRRIACESEEARYLAGPRSPFDGGRFILIPLERPERYVFFDLLVPDFTKRITAVFPPYPWRLKGDD